MWNDRLVLVKEGQMITGRKELSEATGISEASIERILTTLENGQQIEQQKTTKYRLITIVNWKDYQDSDSKVDNRRTTNGQQTDTNKNVNNEKNVNTGEAGASRVTYTIEEDKQKKPSTAKYPHKKEVFSWFPAYEKFWDRHATYCEYSNDCWELGEKTCRAMLKFYEENKHDPHCPVIITPYDIVTKRNNLIAFRDKR